MERVTFSVGPDHKPTQYMEKVLRPSLWGVSGLMAVISLEFWWPGLSFLGLLIPEVATLEAADRTFEAWRFSGGALLMALIALFLPRSGVAGHDSLACDEDGLTCIREGRRYRWAWGDVLSFDFPHPAFGGPKGGARLVVSGRFGWKARLRAWKSNALASSRRMTIHIPDAYDKPLPEVVATLNAFRERALARQA